MEKADMQFELLLPALKSKCAEFQMLDQATLTEEELWSYCVKKKWRNKDISALRIHEKVHDIMAVTLSEYVAYSQVEGFKADNWFSGAAAQDWQELLKPSAKK